MKAILTLLGMLLCLPALTQTSKPASILTKAYADAAQQNKQILLVVGPPRPLDHPGSNDYLKALHSTEVTRKLNADFNLVMGEHTDPGVKALINRYTIDKFPAFLFLNEKGDLIYKDYGSTTNTQKYLSLIDRALRNAQKPSLTDYNTQYRSKRSDITFLKEFIDKRKAMGITTNGALIEDYVKLLYVKDFSDYKTVLYILEAGPFTDGQAYKMAYMNKKIIDSIFKTEPLEKRIAINNLIIKNTMAKAILLKSEPLATSAASFAAGTNSSNLFKAHKAHTENMLNYYHSIKDTASYLRTAVRHYDTYMRLSADSIKKLDERSKEEARRLYESKVVNGRKVPDSMIRQLKANPAAKTTPQNKYNQVMSSIFTVYSISNTLNNAASKVCSTGTRNPEYLSKALLWVRRAIELNDVYGYFDTQAQILYRLGYYHEAEHSQLQGIEKAKKSNMPYDYMEKTYKNIKDRTL